MSANVISLCERIALLYAVSYSLKKYHFIFDYNSRIFDRFYPNVTTLRVDGKNGAPNSNFSKLSELSDTSRARKRIFGLQGNIDKANSRRYHVYQ